MGSQGKEHISLWSRCHPDCGHHTHTVCVAVGQSTRGMSAWWLGTKNFSQSSTPDPGGPLSRRPETEGGRMSSEMRLIYESAYICTMMHLLSLINTVVNCPDQKPRHMRTHTHTLMQRGYIFTLPNHAAKATNICNKYTHTHKTQRRWSGYL